MNNYNVVFKWKFGFKQVFFYYFFMVLLEFSEMYLQVVCWNILCNDTNGILSILFWLAL